MGWRQHPCELYGSLLCAMFSWRFLRFSEDLPARLSNKSGRRSIPIDRGMLRRTRLIPHARPPVYCVQC